MGFFLLLKFDTMTHFVYVYLKMPGKKTPTLKYFVLQTGLEDISYKSSFVWWHQQQTILYCERKCLGKDCVCSFDAISGLNVF